MQTMGIVVRWSRSNPNLPWHPRGEKLPQDSGIFVTLSDFTKQAREEAQQAGIALVDNRDLYARIEKVRRTEPCPFCQAPMILDLSRYGWWLRCQAVGCPGKRDLSGNPGRAFDLTNPTRLVVLDTSLVLDEYIVPPPLRRSISARIPFPVGFIVIAVLPVPPALGERSRLRFRRLAAACSLASSVRTSSSAACGRTPL